MFIRASDADFRAKPKPDGAAGHFRSDTESAASALVLVLATIGLVFVGLMAVAGFTVMAQRRLRALGMLGAMGASHRHIRLVLPDYTSSPNVLMTTAGAARLGLTTIPVGWLVDAPQALTAAQIDALPVGLRARRLVAIWRDRCGMVCRI